MGMKSLPAKAGESGLRGCGQTRRLGAKADPINRVAHQRMSEGGQMDPNLMGPAGFEAASQKAGHHLRSIRAFLLAVGARRFGGAVALQHFPERYGLAPALAHRHAIARPRVAVDRAINPAMGAFGRSPGEGEIAAL